MKLYKSRQSKPAQNEDSLTQVRENRVTPFKRTVSVSLPLALLLLAGCSSGQTQTQAAAHPAGENCTAENKKAVCADEIVKEKVDWGCKLLETKGKSSLPEISQLRYDCCNDVEYLWVQDLAAKTKVVAHPKFAGKDMSDFTDKSGIKIFSEFVKAVKRKPAGDWVEFMWPKLGETDPTTKKVYVKSCKVAQSGENWLVGAGTWK